MNEPSEAYRRAMAQGRIETARAVVARAIFGGREFGSRTIEALIASGVDAPERLLFMTPAELRALRAIPGVGKVALAEIEKYRSRFLPS